MKSNTGDGHLNSAESEQAVSFPDVALWVDTVGPSVGKAAVAAELAGL